MVSKSKPNAFNWNMILYIGLGILGLIIIFAIVKIIQDVFNNPFMTGLADILGNIVYDGGEIINGCASQTDCSQIDDQDVCAKKPDCAYNKGQKKCVITTGETAGQSNFFTVPCFLGIGLVVFVFAWLFFKLITLLRTPFKSMSDGLKQLSSLTTKDPSELSEEIKEEAKDDLSEFKEDFKAIKNRDMTESEIRFATSDLASIKLGNDIMAEINKIQDAAEKKIELQKFEQVFIDIEKSVSEIGKDGELTDAEMAEMHVIAEKVRPPIIGLRFQIFKS